MKRIKVSAKYERFKTVQIHAEIKDQIVDHCDRHGLKIGGYLESLFLQTVSGSLAKQIDNIPSSGGVPSEIFTDFSLGNYPITMETVLGSGSI